MDTAACKTSYTAQLQEQFNEDDQTRLRYDAQAAGDCLLAVSSKIECGQVEEDDAPACEKIFVGSVALGQPCNNSRECAAVAGRSVYCELREDSSSGVCAANTNSTVLHGKAGDTCNTTCHASDSCAITVAPVDGTNPPPQPAFVACYRDDGLFCDAGRCAPLILPGAPCSASEACRDSAFCNFNTGLCTAPQPDGSACDGDNQCLSENCEEVPGAVTEPGFGPPQVCTSATAVTAEQCGRDFSDTSPDSTSPSADATEPGTGAGAP